MRALARTFLIGFLLAASRAFPAATPLDSLGQSFYSPKALVLWELETNPLPHTVRIQKLVPSTMDEQVLSNLVRVGGLTETNRVYRDFLGAKIPKNEFAYRSADDRSSLSIVPAQGCVDLYNPQRSTLMPEAVPDQGRAFQLGTNLLHALRLPIDQFLVESGGKLRAWYYPGTITHYAKRGEPITRPYSMGIEFRRQFDGIPCYQERLYVQFEANEQLAQMELRWHAVQPSAPVAVASTRQIATWIIEGRTRVQSLEVAGPGGRRLQPKGIKKLAIKAIAPHYSAATYHVRGKFDERAALELYPYAVLTADAEIGPDDRETIFLFAPITADALMTPSRKTEKDGFAVFPSALYEKERRAASGQQ